MDFLPNSSERLLSVTLVLGQYPMLGARIRARMRKELFTRGIVEPGEFESQVREDAIQTQKLMGNPQSHATRAID
jgi:hypothetical protein